VDTLCVGALLAIRIRRPGEFQPLVGRSGRAALLLGGGLLGVLAFGALTQLALPVVHQIRNSLWALLFGALTLVALKEPSNLVARVLQGPVLRFFGKYSYGLYVYHGLFHGYLVEARVEERLDALLGSHALAMVVRAIIGVGVSLLIALASYHLLEKHFLALKRYFEVQEEPSTAPMSRPRPTISTAR
jgi:peptidoglycan/LPS O-acetylase OafA/YrhL